jgi:hypothetical protein
MTLLMFVCRFFLFHLYESPKFLLSRGRQAEAVSVVQSIARYNGTQTWLTEDILDDLSGDADDHGPKLSVMEINKRNLSKFSFQKVESLFINRKLGTTTVLLWFMWAAIGMGYPLFNAFLPQYLEHAGEDDAPVPANVVSLAPTPVFLTEYSHYSDVSELHDHLCRWCAGECHSLLHRRHEVYWPQRNNGCVNAH